MVIVLALCFGQSAWADTLVIAGRTYAVAPFVLEHDEVLAPIAPALRLVGATVAVAAEQVTITAGDQSFTCALGSPSARAGTRVLRVAAPRYVDGSLFLPAKAIGRWLGLDTRFDAATRTLTLWPVVKVAGAPGADGVAVTVRSQSAIQYTSGRLNDPPRAFIDVKGVSLGMAEQQLALSAGLVSRVRVAQFSADPAVVRLVIDLHGDAHVTTSVSEAGRLLTVMVGDPMVIPPAQYGTPEPEIMPFPTITPYRIIDLALAPRSAQQSELIIAADGPMEVQTNFDEKARTLHVYCANGSADLAAQKVATLRDAVVEKIETRTTPDNGLHIAVTFKKKDTGYLVHQEATSIRLLFGVFSIADMTIVLDPGHGGHDSGAVGFKGTTEKAMNLDIALRAKKMLESAGARVVMTRADDTFITLDQRPTIANGCAADIFVSIHNNSSAKRNSAAGTETYYSTSQSRELASIMHTELLKTLELPNRGVHQRNFLVIRKSTMPAVLLEIAFLNNEKEEALLGTPSFRQRAAEAIVSGIRKYAASNAWRQKRGDLSSIIAVAATTDAEQANLNQ